MNRADFGVIGGGIVGLATARSLLQKFPGRSVYVFEKEAAVARHQSGRNSGVIHSGLYYAPGSKKALLCRDGARRMVEFCREQNIAHEICGKLVIATEERELPALAELHRRAQANGVPGVKELGPEALREIEPHCKGLRALHVPSAGIVDYTRVAQALAVGVESAGGVVRAHCRITRCRRENDEWILESTQGEFRCAMLINCGGLFSDRLARAAGARGPDAQLRIVPFRGEYYTLRPERATLVRNLIYPVPDPRFPFLGVHFTRRIDGAVECGPNAVLAFKREGYTRASFSLTDTADALTFGGFWRMAARHWKTGLGELYRSFSKPAFVQALQKLVPEITAGDLQPGGAGVRAQAILPDGTLAADFHFARTEAALHVLNAPSPAATASLAIAEKITANLS